MKHIYLPIFLILSIFCTLKAQVYHNPIAAKQSHPELEITKIEINNTETIISLKITNKLDKGGWFCADDNIYIKNTKGTEIFKLIRSENIPTCPNKFEFSIKGESLEFKLFFPKIPAEISFIDLIEDCNNACFFFNGIILDNNHNENIHNFEKGFELYQNEKLNEAIQHFKTILDNKSKIQSHIYGLSYYYLITIYHKENNETLFNKYLNLLYKSNLEDKNTFINELKRLKIIN